jgi:hypothetical protein
MRRQRKDSCRDRKHAIGDGKPSLVRGKHDVAIEMVDRNPDGGDRLFPGRLERDEDTARSQGAAVVEEPFDHPLLPRHWVARGIEDVPFLETWTGPEGGALAVQVSYAQDEHGNLFVESGLVELEQRELSPEELLELRASNPSPLPAIPAPVVPDDVLALQGDAANYVFLVSLRRDGVEHVSTLVDRDVALGLVRNQTEFDDAWERALESRRTVLRTRQDPVVADVAALGGRVVARCSTLFCLSVEMTAAQVVSLSLRNPDIDRVDLSRPGGAEVGDAGASIAAGTQITAMVADGWDGQYGSTRVRIAQIEDGGVKITHPGFKDGTGTAVRIGTLQLCNPTCATQTSFGAFESDHATAVAGLLLGDLNDGQDPAITDGNDRWDKSGYSHEAYLSHAIRAPADADFQGAVDYLAGLSSANRPRIVNVSAWYGTDATCLGENAQSRRANDLLEAGQLVFKSAGNYTPSGPNPHCTVTSPGSAIGVFTVGGHGRNLDAPGSDPTTNPVTVTEVRSDGIWDPPDERGSAHGGNSSEGKNRTIIDLTSYAIRKELFSKSTASPYGVADAGTSLAAPTVAAAAANFVDFLLTEFPNTPVAPEKIFVNMLLNGDRWDGSTVKTSGFDRIWGGGRLRMRTFDSAGLDAPACWYSGSTCVAHGAVVSITLNDGNPLPATANHVKAAIYWYDSRHETGTQIDNIDLRLRQTSNQQTLRSSTSAHDEKEQILYGSPAENPGGRALAIDIVGTTVTGTSSGCSNARKVFYAILWEDSARDDVDGPENPGGGTGFNDVVPERQ